MPDTLRDWIMVARQASTADFLEPFSDWLEERQDARAEKVRAFAGRFRDDLAIALSISCPPLRQLMAGEAVAALAPFFPEICICAKPIFLTVTRADLLSRNLAALQGSTMTLLRLQGFDRDKPWSELTDAKGDLIVSQHDDSLCPMRLSEDSTERLRAGERRSRYRGISLREGIHDGHEPPTDPSSHPGSQRDA